jgi:hypothetical protein
MENYMAVLFSGIVATLFIALGLPLAYKKIPPNRWYGYRVSRYQYEDDEIWYAINVRGGLHFVYAGGACLVFAAFCALFIDNAGAQLILMVVFTALLAVFITYEITWSLRMAHRMAREKGLIEEGEKGEA